jgi:hypothetical protein
MPEIAVPPDGRIEGGPSGGTITIGGTPLAVTFDYWPALYRPLSVSEEFSVACQPMPASLTPEEVAERVAQRAAEEAAAREAWEAYRAERRRREEEYRLAAERSRQLLDRCLTAAQRASMTERNYFTLTSNRGHQWQINCYGQAGNVSLLGASGMPLAHYCAHPAGGVPDPAAWLVQMMTLATDELAFLRVANPYGGDHEAARCILNSALAPPKVTVPRRRMSFITLVRA